MKRHVKIWTSALCSFTSTAIIFSVANLQGNRVKEAFAQNIEAKAVCVMEQNSRRILFELNGDTRLPMASTTKIATAVTVLNLCNDIKSEIKIPNAAVGIEGSSVYLKENDVYSVEDLLYGLMLRSGNDCATALALYFSEDISTFSAKMNETAQKAGAFATCFQNPHGLPCKNHYTTARDLSLISCYAMENPLFKEIVATEYYEPCHWKNKNKMVTEYNGIGIKTGYTKEAGRCLVSAAENEGMTVICTVLSCPDMYRVSNNLIKDVFSSFRYKKIIGKEDVFNIVSGDKNICGKIKEDFYYPMMEGEENQLEIITKPINNGEIVGQIEIYLSKRLLFCENLYKL